MNGDGKRQSIFLSVIGIATLLVAIVGATFAWFSTRVEGDSNNITITTAMLGTVTFTDGQVINLQDIFPEDPEATPQGSKTFTISAESGTTVLVDYVIYLNVTENDLSAVANAGESNYFVYSLTGTIPNKGTDDTGGTVADSVTNQGVPTVGKTSIGSGRLGTKGAVHSYVFTIRFLESGENQNAAQGKTFNGTIEVEAGTQYTAGGQPYIPGP